VADILLGIVDEAHLDPLVAMLDTLPSATKAATIGVIGTRNGRRFSARIMPLTADADPAIRAAAFGALAGVATPSDVPALLTLLEGANADAVPQVQKAIVAAVGLSVPGPARTRPLIQALPASAHPERILDVLPQIGGPEALAAVAAQFASPAEDRKAAAFRALTRWTGTDATQRMLAIAASGDATYRNQAFSAFVRQIAASSLPADQKILHFRRALALSSTVGDRRIVMRSLERIRTFKSFLLVVPLLDDGELAGEAAGSLMRIALPSGSDAADGLSGTVVRDALTKAMPLVTGPQRDADRERIRAYLADMPAGDGFVPLFNGKDLSGWQGLVENPIVRAKLSPADLAAKQAAANAKMQANWTVRDGTIVFNGSGDNLCTVREYGDFEMIVDWRITKGGDSGIYLRGTPQVQIWDPARTDVGAQVGSGGLYNNQKNPSAPLARVDNQLGEWNTFRITMIGDKVTVYLNGTKVAENVTMENYWDRTQPIFARGPIELQAHGTDLAFRDIYVRELSDAAYNLTEEERADGFVALFNGRNLDGWAGNKVGYKVEDGAIVFDPKAPDLSNVYTEREYGDFQFRFEFQLTPGANSGVGIRAPREGDAAYVGMEIQVLDNDAPMYATLQPYQYHGSVYGIIPATRGFLRPVGEWNTEEILVRGSRIRVTLNGTVIVDGDLAAAAKGGTMDHRPHPGLDRASGYIGWLSHDSVVRFRNVRIKDLSAAK
jgi:HEAT repeat protein